IARAKNKTTRFDLRQSDSTDAADADGKKSRWEMPVENTPFHRITSEVRFEIQVTDEDDLQLETPIQGMIRIKADRPPSGSADVVHRVVLPSAKPIIEYRLNDDYGVGEVSLHMQIERMEAATPKATAETEPDNTTDPDAPVKARPEEKHTVKL